MITQSRWPHQLRIREQVHQNIAAGCKAQVVSSATGTGKSLVMFDLIRDWLQEGHQVALYTHRKLLREQLAKQLQQHGIRYGNVAAGEPGDHEAPVQLCMIQTAHRSWIKSGWLPEATRTLVDEAHLMATGETLRYLRKRLERPGEALVGVTATPVSLGHLYQDLVRGANVSEGIDCGALLPAKAFAPDEPDVKAFVKRVNVDDQRIDPKQSLRYVQQVVGRIVKVYQELNPFRLPTIVFAPCVKSSIWLSRQFCCYGIRAGHIDGQETFYDGVRHVSENARQDLLQRFREGECEVICNRFVLREGIDLPEIGHLILACVMGSVQTYVQSVGRALRNHFSLPGFVTVQDHGGNFYRFGLPDEDREWDLSRGAAEQQFVRQEQMRTGQAPEPIVCPRCFHIRQVGSECPQCHFVGGRSTRRIVQRDGSIKEVSGKIFKQRKKAEDDLRDDWVSCFWASRKKGTRTWQQVAAYWALQHNNRWPQPDWPGVPTRVIDKVRRIDRIETRYLQLPPRKGTPEHEHQHSFGF